MQLHEALGKLDRLPLRENTSKQTLNERGLTKSERHNREMEKISNKYKAQQDKYKKFLLSKGVSKEDIDELARNSGLHGNALGEKAHKMASAEEWKKLHESRKTKLKESSSTIEPGDIYDVVIKELDSNDIDHHASDLYVRKTPESTEIINRLSNKSLVSTFKDNIDGDIWYELPFCYTPHFNESVKNRSRKTKLKESAAGNNHWSVKYQDLIEDLVDRVDDPNDEDDVMQAIDDGLIYTSDMWTAVEEILSPTDLAEWDDVFMQVVDDVYAELKDRGLIESLKSRKTKLKESNRTPTRKSLKESHTCNRNYTNMMFAIRELKKKGYSQDEAIDIAQHMFDEAEGNRMGHPLEWFINRVLSKEEYNKEFGIEESVENNGSAQMNFISVKDDARSMLKQIPMATIVQYMDDEIREEVHRDIAPCSDIEFLENYMIKHFLKYHEKFTIN